MVITQSGPCKETCFTKMLISWAPRGPRHDLLCIWHSSKWRLILKPSSKIVTSAAVGSVYVSGDKVGDYTYEADFPVLGHTVTNSGSIARSFDSTVRKMWKAFWGNAGSRGARTLGRSRLAMLIVRSVQPLFEFQCARWPVQITYLNKLDTLQRKMVSIAFGLRRTAAQSMEQYNRNCCRVAAPYIRQPWSHVWCKRMKTWAETWHGIPGIGSLAFPSFKIQAGWSLDEFSVAPNRCLLDPHEHAHSTEKWSVDGMRLWLMPMTF